MNTINLNHLISSLEKKLSAKFSDPILCTQYAWWLVQAITQKDELTLMSNPEIPWDQSQQEMLDDALDKLIVHAMPLAYLLGSMPFAGLDILVRPPILIPRPETEEWCINLIEQLETFRNEPLMILDLCTGSGCIALALADAFGKASIYATDNNPTALALAQENARHNQITNITFLQSDLFESISSNLKFDLIVSNPPYIDPNQWESLENSVKNWEDKNALIAPDHGLALIKKIIEIAPHYLNQNKARAQKGIPQLVFEIDTNQAAPIIAYMKKHNYSDITVIKDLQAKDRVISGRIDNVALAGSQK